MKKKEFTYMLDSIDEARRIKLIDSWLKKFPNKKYFKSRTNISEHLNARILYDFVQDCTSGAR